MHNLHRFLVDYDMAMLRALAQNRGVTLVTNRQTQVADQLAAALLDPLSVRVALAQLSPHGQEALDTLLAAGGRMRAPKFSRQFGQVRPTGPGRLEREALWQNPANPVEELLYLGLVFRAFYEDEGGPGEFVFVPDDLLSLLPQPQAAPPTFKIEVVPEPARQDDKGPALVQDLFAYLVFLQTHDVHPYADGRLGRRDVTALRSKLLDAGERRMAFLRHLADRLGFVVRPGEFLRLEAAPVKRWLTASYARQLGMLQEAWRDDPTWNDLYHVPSLVCDEAPGWQNDPVATRRALLGLLARCPSGAWWSSTSFVAAVKEFHPDFQRPDGDYTSWYIHDAASKKYLSGFESWDRVEGALIADLLTGPLHWLGIVARGTKARGTMEQGPAYRLTEAEVLPGEQETQPSLLLVVHPDFQVEVPAPVNLYARFQLERLADLESLEPCRYRLTAGGLGRVLGRGIRVEQVLDFLRQASEGLVPANVVGQLQLWAGRFGQVQIEEAALLRVKSERVLKELSVLPETRSLIGQVLSPTSALVRKGDLPRLRKALHALGFLPEQAADDPTERG